MVVTNLLWNAFIFVFQLNKQCLKAKDFQKLACCDKTPGKKYDSCGNCKNATAPDFNKEKVYRIVQCFFMFIFASEILLCFDRSHACFFFKLVSATGLR